MRKKNKSVKFVIISGLCFIVLMMTAYAAFNTNITLNAKGNILPRKASSILKDNVVLEGDGLYKSSYEDDKYVFRGKKPNNYITFNNELWRIVSVESDDTLKIVRDQTIGLIAYDTPGNRNSSTSTFCTTAATYGCSAWASLDNLVGNPSAFSFSWPLNNSTDTESSSGTVINDSTLNTYLNNDYYNSLSTDKNLIVNGDFYVGSYGNHLDTEDIATNLKQTKQYTWNGKVALISAMEYMIASKDEDCTTPYSSYKSNSTCGVYNWLNYSQSSWILNIAGGVNYGSSFTRENGSFSNASTQSKLNVRPTVFLKKDITISGSGSNDAPYQISKI